MATYLHIFVGNDLVLLLHSLLEAEEPPIDVAVGRFVVSRCRIVESRGIGLSVLILVHLCTGRPMGTRAKSAREAMTNLLSFVLRDNWANSKSGCG